MIAFVRHRARFPNVGMIVGSERRNANHIMISMGLGGLRQISLIYLDYFSTFDDGTRLGLGRAARRKPFPPRFFEGFPRIGPGRAMEGGIPRDFRGGHVFSRAVLASERLQRRPAGVALQRGGDVFDDLFRGHFSER